MELTSGPFTFRIGSCQVVILSGGGAGGRDLPSADRFDVVDGNARGVCSVLDLRNCISAL